MSSGAEAYCVPQIMGVTVCVACVAGVFCTFAILLPLCVLFGDPAPAEPNASKSGMAHGATCVCRWLMALLVFVAVAGYSQYRVMSTGTVGRTTLSVDSMCASKPFLKEQWDVAITNIFGIKGVITRSEFRNTRTGRALVVSTGEHELILQTGRQIMTRTASMDNEVIGLWLKAGMELG